MFSNFYYPDTPADTAATGSALTEEQGRAALQAYLQDEFPGDAAAQNAAVAVYDDATAKQKISDPQLRAGFAALAMKLNLGGTPTDVDELCLGAGGGAASCDDAKAKLKKAKKKLKRAEGALKRAKQSGDEAKVAKAKKKVKRAKKKVKKAKQKVKGAC